MIKNKIKDIQQFDPYTNYEMEEEPTDQGWGRHQIYRPKYERGL